MAQLGSEVGVDEEKLLNALKISEKPAEDGSLNVGNKVTNDIKLMVKANRRTGVHVTPTILFNGIEEGKISSGFTGQQWEEWLNENVI